MRLHDIGLTVSKGISVTWCSEGSAPLLISTVACFDDRPAFLAATFNWFVRWMVTNIRHRVRWRTWTCDYWACLAIISCRHYHSDYNWCRLVQEIDLHPQGVYAGSASKCFEYVVCKSNLVDILANNCYDDLNEIICTENRLKKSVERFVGQLQLQTQ